MKITPAMRTALYLHWQNGEHNLRHIEKGGINVPDMRLYKAGKVQDAYNHGTIIKLTENEVKAITDAMTPEEVQFAKLIHEYYNGSTFKDQINSVSEQLKGYAVAMVRNYFPIKTDPNFLQTEFEALRHDGTLAGMGEFKERQKGASNPILLLDADAQVRRSIKSEANYVGLAIPVRDFNKIWRGSLFTESMTENGEAKRNSYMTSVSQAAEQTWGGDAKRYVEKLMKDVQEGARQTDSPFNRAGKRYAGAVLLGNLGVAAKQMASYPTAVAELGWKPIIQALFDMGDSGVGKVDLDLIARFTPDLWLRRQGWGTAELSDMSANRGRVDQFVRNHKWANLIQGADLATTEKLWKAAEYYVRNNLSEYGLTRNDVDSRDGKNPEDAYYRAVADKYNKTIERTQPNYQTMQRPQLLRSDSDLVRSLMSFKTQPFQNFNVLYDAAGNLLAKREAADQIGGEEAQSQLKAAKTSFNRAVTSQLAQLAVFAAMTIGWGIVRGKDDKYRDEDGDLDIGTILFKSIPGEMAGGAFSMIPFGDVGWEVFRAVAFKDRYYGMESVNVGAVNDAVSSFVSLGSFIRDGLETGFDFRTSALMVDRTTKTASKLLGVPYENLHNLFDAIALNTLKALNGGILGEYKLLQFEGNPVTGGGYDLLYRALKKNDLDTARYIMEDLQSYRNSAGNPITGKTIATNMKNRANRIGDTLSQEAMALIGMVDKLEVPHEESSAFSEDSLRGSAWIRFNDQRADTQRRILAELERSPAWEDLSDEEKNKATSGVLTYAKETALTAHSDGAYEPQTSWVLKAQNAAREYGVDVGTFLAVRAHVSGFSGEGVTNYKGLQIWEYVSTLGLTEEQEQRLMADLGVGKKVLEMDADTRQDELDEAREKAENPDRDDEEEEDED